MAIFTRGKSKAINSPRHLTIRHARRSAVLHKVSRGILAVEDASIPHLNPGQEKLNSYWAPSLEAGEEHEITVTQTIAAPTVPPLKDADNKPLRLVSEQDFFVDAPQFSLPAGSVYSVYPPHGYPDDHRILPHVVLSDPHLPWERMGSPASEKDGHADDRNKVPWLALFSFTNEELKLPENALGGKSYKQTGTFTVKMSVGELRGIPNVANPITDDMGLHVNDAEGEFIFLKPDLFKNLFSKFDDKNKRQDSGGPETTRYQYLSHVREINTAGMAVAGVEEIGIFSIVVGSRSGPLDNKAPVSVFVHLVSIEGVEGMGSFPTKDYVALCSLHSWSYTVMPPGMLNVHEAFDNIGKTLNVLRPSDSVTTSLDKGGKVQRRIAARLRDGYSLVKYKTQTGEQTVALYRGPLTPTVVGPTVLKLSEDVAKACSNSGQDLQILDREVGIMDISYSSAWNLGRTLALGNEAFCAALYRLRAAIHTRAMKETKIDAVRSTGSQESYRSRADVLSDLKQTIEYLDGLHVGDPGHVSSPDFRIGPPRKRWQRPRLSRREYPLLHYNSSKIKDEYLERAIEAALDLGKATDESIYDETNTPKSTDWMIVLAFVMDRMFLSGVPAHYMISDPSHLPPESLRFFYIDPSWVDALVDGALSLANHSGEDRDRVAIKYAINAYLTHYPEHHPEYTPQVPRYGFYLRSDLVSMFPDLKVEIESDPPICQAPLLRHEIVTDGVMMGLADRQPGLPEFKSLVFTQPPHQQRFAAAWKLTQDEIDIDIRKQYTISQEEREKDADRHEALKPGIKMKPTDPNNWFVWSTEAESGTDDVRLLRLPFFAEQQLSLLRQWSDDEVNKGHQKPFDDDTPNSALLAMQLTDPIYSLTVKLQGASSLSTNMSPRTEDSSAPKAPRTLISTVPSRITPLVPPDEDEGEDDGDTTASMTAEDTSIPSQLGRHEDYRVEPHVSQTNLAPHVRAIPPLAPRLPSSPPTVSRARESPGGGGTATAPKYNCMVYSQANDKNQVETTGENLPQDLIFSIHVEDNENSDYQLAELDIRIALGPVKPEDHRLMQNYNGPGPRMLSNLRFNVVSAMDKRGGINYLVLRILPRSSTKLIKITKVQDLSFLLCLAQVNKFTRDSPRESNITNVALQTEATYRAHQGDTVKYGSFNARLKNDDVEPA
ncbi:hypothetical protein DL770_009084 [Monosporascus sp. CRB-9-2]|nr:hypothetical protein DL770_009084 [Monosporascus sp. CRB-9-2]